MGDKIIKEETERLGFNPIAFEQEFPKSVRQIKGYVYERNNINNPYNIDHRLKRLKDIIAWVDMEARGIKLSQLPRGLIHVPLYSFASFDRQTLNSISPKIEYYKTHQKNSFHLAWSYWEDFGYLIIAKDILNSNIKKSHFNHQRNKLLPVYEVPLLECRKTTNIDLVPTLIDWLKEEGII